VIKNLIPRKSPKVEAILEIKGKRVEVILGKGRKSSMIDIRRAVEAIIRRKGVGVEVMKGKREVEVEIEIGNIENQDIND